MYRNTSVGPLPLGLSRRLLAQCCSSLLACLIAICGLALCSGFSLHAQSTSGGGIQGTITDPSGAVVRDAEVTATNTDTGVQTTRKTNGGGTYSLQPLSVGPYNVEVVAKGFRRLLQENVTVDNASVVGLNIKLTIGGQNDTITVTDAPPFLDTTDATLGGTIENELYSQLPLSMNGGPRDPTAFQYLMPGVQENPANNSGQGANNGNSGIYAGTGQTNLNENYIEGVPVSNINQQGSSSPVSAAVSVDAVDQFSVQTSGASTSFGGAGVTNYTIKSGGNQFHGTVFDFIRNTAFDTWGYFAKVPAASGFAVKPGEHQNSYGGSVGGPIFKDKLFFFASYEGYHFTKISNTPQYITIPTLINRQGNFTDQFGTVTPSIADPTGAFFGSRPFFQGNLNGVPTYNVIEPSKISSISNYLQSALPAPTNLATFSNYLAVLPQANADYSVDGRLDYTLNARNKVSLVGVGGNVGFGAQPNYQNFSQLPVPYANGDFTNQKTASGILSYTYIASQSLINSLKYGYTRNWGERFPLTSATGPNLCSVPGGPKGPCNSTAAGITNLPPGNASDSMPAVSFTHVNGPSNEPSGWSSNSSSGPVGTNTYSVIDNLIWTKGRHNITFGAQVQWDETNGGSFGGYSQTLTLRFDDSDTEVSTSNTGFSNGQGDAYASFLVGAVYSHSVKTQSIQDVGARYRPMAPYIQDNWQVSPKLTLNLGLRYDYLQPYHEVQNRIAFLNPTIINPIVGIPGVLMYAGFPNASTPPDYAPYLCHCTTPVHPYNQNFQPRIGFAYAYTPTTIFSGGFGLQLTHSGGVGGGSGATQGTQNNSEFVATSGQGQSGSTGVPEFYLNPSIASAVAITTPPPLSNQGTQGTDPVTGAPIAVPCVQAGACSPFSSIPPWLAPGVKVNPLQSTGNYDYTQYPPNNKNQYQCSTSDQRTCNPQGVNFADPYYGGRGPQLITYNFQVQRMINKKAVLSIAYSGTQTHFLPGGAGRGPAQNTYSVDYDQQYKGALTGGGYAGAAPPFARWSNGAGSTVSQSLRPFPQFGGFSDIWGNTGNANYNSIQISVIQRPWHNISGLVNYTRQKEIDDTGNHRTQYPVGPQDGNFTKNYSAGRVDRSLGTSNQTNGFNAAWSYTFPIGRGQAFFATNRIAGLIGGGWALNGIYKYRDGYPLQITNGGGCNTSSNGGQGTCYPDYTPGFDKRAARINGRWGRGPGANAANPSAISYLNFAGFQCADSFKENPTYSCGGTNSPTATWKLGNAARTAPYGLTGPGWWDIDLGLRRTFNVRETATLHLTFQVEADVSNATNSTFFNIASSSWDSSSYGMVGGQNKSIQPRDWQFAGRFRF